jgi:DedD protein
VKERLTGAIILVLLIVLLVPELLSGPKGPTAPAPAGGAAPSSEEPPLRSYTINLGDDAHSRAAVRGSSGPAMPQPSGPEQPTQPAAGPPGATPSSPTQPGAKQSNAPQSGTQDQPSAHSEAPTHTQSPPRAQSAAHTPSAGHTQSPAHTQPPTVQPSKPRVAKAKANAQPQKSSAPSTSESGWAVQLGVFASRENAERLAVEVRVKGFNVSVSPVASGSRKLYRVRVGPTADRTAAEELQGRLKAAGRPGGTVVPYS